MSKTKTTKNRVRRFSVKMEDGNTITVRAKNADDAQAAAYLEGRGRIVSVHQLG